MPSMMNEAGSGTAEADISPETFDVNAPRVEFAETNAAGSTLLKDNDIARDGPRRLMSLEENDVTPPGVLAESVRLLPAPKIVAPPLVSAA